MKFRLIGPKRQEEDEEEGRNKRTKENVAFSGSNHNGGKLKIDAFPAGNLLAQLPSRYIQSWGHLIRHHRRVNLRAVYKLDPPCIC